MRFAEISEKLGETVGMRKGEYLKTFSLFLYLFFIVASYVVSKTVRDALYLSKFGAMNLPYVYIGIAVLAGLFVSVYLRIAHRFKQHILLSMTLLFFAVNVVLFWSLFKYHFSWLYPVIYIWAGIFGVIGPMQVWTLSSAILTTREAKRLYGFIGSGGILGGIAGGFFSSSMVRLIGTENLLLTIAGFLLLCIPIVNIIWYKTSHESENVGIAGLSTSSNTGPSNLRQSWSLISHCRYLFLIAGIISLGSIVTTTVDWQFKAIAQTAIGSKDQLTVFFGNFYGYLGIASFLVQIFLTSRMMRKYGIGFTLMLLPLGLILGSASILLYTSLWTAIILKGPDQLFKHSIDRSTVEMLYLPVPSQIKSGVKSFIDTIVWRFADGMAGILLLVLTAMLSLSIRQVSFVNMGLMIVWLAVAYLTKREYVSALRSAISKQEVDPDKLTINISDPATIASFISSLNSKDTDEILYVLDLMDFVNQKKDFLPHLEKLINHSSPEVRAKAVTLLNEIGEINDRKLAKKVKGLLNDKSPEVQTEAINFVRAHDGGEPIELMKPLLESNSYNVKGAAICCILSSNGNNNEECYATAQNILNEMLSSNEEQARQEAARVLGEIDCPSPLHLSLIKLFQDNSPQVVCEALQSAGKIRNPEFVPFIVDLLERKNTKVAAREALIKYSSEILPTLEEYLNDKSTDINVRRTLPHAISQIGSSRAVEILINNINSDDQQLRLMATKGLNKIRAQAEILPEEWQAQSSLIEAQFINDIKEYCSALAGLHAFSWKKGDLLRNCLENRLESQLENIFRLIGLIYSPDDIYHAYYGLASGNAMIRANALELLDNLLTGEYKKLLIPIIDDEISIDKKLAVGESLGVTYHSGSADVLAQFLDDPDPLIVMCAIDAIHTYQVVDLHYYVEMALEHPDLLVRETAEKVWTSIQTDTFPVWSNYDFEVNQEGTERGN